jgi:hypothetical protein
MRKKMKKLAAFTIIGAALALSACANKQAVDYGYEKQAPYASDRTVGTSQPAPAAKGDTVFKAKQNK